VDTWARPEHTAGVRYHIKMIQSQVESAQVTSETGCPTPRKPHSILSFKKRWLSYIRVSH